MAVVGAYLCPRTTDYKSGTPIDIYATPHTSIALQLPSLLQITV